MLPAQLGDACAGVEIGPIGQREIGDLARVVVALGDADLVAGDVDGAERPLILQICRYSASGEPSRAMKSAKRPGSSMPMPLALGHERAR